MYKKKSMMDRFLRNSYILYIYKLLLYYINYFMVTSQYIKA